MRLSGRDIAMDGTPDDSESESTSPASYLQADKQMRTVIERSEEHTSELQSR